MPEFEYTTRVPAAVAEAFAWHARPGAFERVAPPWERMRVLERAGTITDGSRLVIELRKGPFPIRWVALHEGYEEGRQFCDVQVRGPFAAWRHEHRFEPAGPEECALQDRITYRLPGGALGQLVAGGVVEGDLRRLFRYRAHRLAADLGRHASLPDRRFRRVVVTGASGLVGSALTAFLTTGGHRVDRLVRRAPSADDEIRWDPAQGEIDAPALEGADAVVHLAGESVSGGPWTPARKEAILQSRVAGTGVLCRALAGLERPPSVLVSASAVGYYGDRADEVLTEASAPGTGFLARVSTEWEAATQPARDAGIRVVNLRIGIVLSPRGGALGMLLPVFRLGLGGWPGSGRQWMSWIALDDLVGAIHHLAFVSEVAGPVNATAPEPVDFRQFARVLGRVLRRPALFPAPAFALRLALGEMAQEVMLSGARVRPQVLERDGFRFLQPGLAEALRCDLGAADKK